MEKFKVSFTADNQQLKAIGTKHASDTYADIEATFVLGNRWTDMDSVSAVWWNDFTRIATVLDSEGKCVVPHEVLTRKGCVRVNLVGSVMEGDELKTRLTSYSAEAVQVNEKIKLTGSETSEITPSQFEQFVAVVIAEVKKVTGMAAEAVTLPAGSDATAEYRNGVLYLGIPQGIQGETGNGIESVVFDNYTLRFTFTDGTVFTTPSIRGADGNGIRSIAKTGTSGLVDTYTITFDDGSTTTYTVTNGAKGEKGETGATPSFSIGTVETLEPTEDATATITGTAENPVLNLGIPKGEQGDVSRAELDRTVTDLKSEISGLEDGNTLTFIKQYDNYKNRRGAGAVLTTDLKSCVTKTMIDFKKGDIVYIGAGYSVMFTKADASYFAGWTTGSYTFTNDETAYIEVRNATQTNLTEAEVAGVPNAISIENKWEIASKVEELDIIINGEKTLITTPTPTSGGYYASYGTGVIQLVSGSGYYYPKIDLSAYVGQKAKVSFNSTGSTSTRETALCDSDGNVGGAVTESTIVANGYAEFDISVKFNQLYVSYNSSASGLVIEFFDGGIINNMGDEPLQCVYVSATNGDDSNNGSAMAPFATIQKGIDSGALIVRVEAGNYANFGVLNRKAPLTIMLWDMPQYSTSVPEVAKIEVSSSGYGVHFGNCTEINLSDVWVNGSAYDCFRLENIGKINCTRCFACDTSDANSMGFRITNSNGVFIDCKAWDISKDGFNIHLYGDTQFINCVAYDCGDDGISHHEGCTGAIIGGEYYNCAKGGVASPYSGAQIDVHNVYSHNNRFGLYAMTTDGNPSCKGRVSNCVFKNNTDYDIDIATNGMVGWNNIYDTKYVYAGATFVEF